MARLEAISKALYYPTDLRVLGLFIEHHLKLDGVQANWGSILDPCCGTGEAVAFIRDQIQAMGTAAVHKITSKPSYRGSSYGYRPTLRPEWTWVARGVELDEQRAEAAREWLGKKNIIHAALEQMSKPPLRSTMFDILFLNPPYDDVGGKREELRFLRMATPFLNGGGLAILVLPDRFVDGGSHSARLLNLLRSLGLNQDIRVFKFPEPEYQQFKQVIVVASKGRPGGYMAKKDLEIDCVVGEWKFTGQDWEDRKGRVDLTRHGYPRNEKQDIPSIMKRDGDPPVPSIFGAGDKALEQLIPFLGDPAKGSMDMRPLMPMGQEHGAMVAASGALNGMELKTKDGRRLLIRGSDYKTIITTKEKDVTPDGREVQIVRETEKIVSRLALLDLATGDIELADSQYQQERYEDLLLTHASTFVKVAEKLYPPIVTPEVFARWETKLAHIRAPSTLAWHDNGMFEAQAWRGAAILQCWQDKQVAILDGEMSTGKAQPLDENVLTPTGWKQMGDVEVGDKVIGSDGKPAEVTGVFPQGDLPVYRCTFTDGSTVECSDDHLWQVNTPLREWRSNAPVVKTLGEIRADLAHSNGNLKWFIPMVEPVEFEEADELPLDPYLLGLLLGDGGMTAGIPYFSTADTYLLEQVKARLPEGITPKHAGNYDYRLTGKIGAKANPLTVALRNLGLMGKKSEGKFVPGCYKWASHETRLAVLQGLIDTDGYVSADNRAVEFTTASRQLARDVQFLVQSIGGRANIAHKVTTYRYKGKTREGQLAYRMHLRIPLGIKPCRLPRKLEGWRDATCRPPTRAFKSVEYVGNKECQCITVASPNGLYVTSHFVVTHNTLISLAAAAIAALRRRPGNRHIIVILPPKDDLLAKWAKEAEKALAHFEPKIFQIGIKSYPRPNGVKGKVKMPIMELKDAFSETGLTVILMKSTTAKLASGIEDIPLPKRKRYQVVGKSDTWSFVPSKDDMEQDNPGAKFVFFHDKGWTWEQAREHQAEKGSTKNQWKVVRVHEYEACPRCFEDPRGEVDDDEDPELKSGRERKCRVCGEGLWARKRDKHKNARFPLARYIREYFSSRYILIIDEAHETKAADSAISYAASDLVYASYKSVMMTGTLFGGKASSIFFLLYRAVPEFRQLYKFDEVQKFIDDYGLWERITKRYQRMYKGSLQSGYKTFKQSPTERPGVAPGMVMLLLPVACYISLDDLGHAMPEYSEHTLFVDADPKLFSAVESFLGSAATAAAEASRKEPRDARPMAQYRQARLGVTNLPFGPDAIGVDTSIEPIIYGPPKYPKDHLFQKEEALARLCWQEKQAGRRILCFVGQIHRRDPTPRLIEQLRKFGVQGVKLDSKIKKRVPWLTRAAKEYDIVFCSPEIVSVGVDLHMFHTAVWYSPHYNMYLVPQANRRLYRLQQDQDVHVYYLAYNRLPEAPAFAYVAEKMAAQQALRGDIRAGLARLLGEETFVQKLQDAVVGDIPQLDSDLTIDDLPALPTDAELAALEVKEVQDELKKTPALQRKRAERASWLELARKYQVGKAKRKRRVKTPVKTQATLFDGTDKAWKYSAPTEASPQGSLF